jgi:hypothetical protein
MLLLRFVTLSLSLTLVGCLLVPLAASAADGEVGGKGVRAASRGQPVALGERPVLVGLDPARPFGTDVRPVPGVDIRIEGAREVLVLPDGTLHVVLGNDED